MLKSLTNMPQDTKNTTNFATVDSDISFFFNEIHNQYAISDIGGLIKEAREIKRMTQAQLSQRCGLSRTYISRIERNEVELRMPALVHLIERGFDGTISIKITV